MKRLEETNEKKLKLPMYYEQIYSLMKHMAKCYINYSGFEYARTFRQFYSRVRFELTNDKKEHYDNKIKEIRTTASKKYKSWDDTKGKYILNRTYDLEVEIFQDLEDVGLFKALKQNLIELELGGG